MSALKGFLLLIGLACAALLAGATQAAEPWSVAKLNAAYVVNTDGSVDATEDYTIDFGATRVTTFTRAIAETFDQGFPTYRRIKMTVLSVDDGIAPLPYQRRDVTQSLVVRVGDGTKPLSANQRIRIKYRITGALTSSEDWDQFFWDIRGDAPAASIKSATISVTAPSLQGVQCRQIPVSIIDPAIECAVVTSTKSAATFSTTIELPAPVGLVLLTRLTKGSVTVPPLDTTGLPTQQTSSQPGGQVEDEGLKAGSAVISLIAAVAGLALLGVWRRSSANNNPRRFGIVWLAVAWVLTVANVFLLTANTGFEDWAWAPAELIVALLIAMSAFVVGVIYVRRGGMLDAIRAGEQLLAHWTYSSAEWQLYAQGEQQTRQSEGKGRLISVAVVLVLLCGFSLFMDSQSTDDGPSFFIISLVVSAIIMPLVIAANALYLRLADPRRVHTAEAWIALDGVYLQGVMTTWHRDETLPGLAAELVMGFSGNKLDDVRLTPGSPSLLEFDYSWWNRRTGTQSATLRVPVPVGQETWAQNIIAQFKASTPPVAV